MKTIIIYKYCYDQSSWHFCIKTAKLNVNNSQLKRFFLLDCAHRDIRLLIRIDLDPFENVKSFVWEYSNIMKQYKCHIEL